MALRPASEGGGSPAAVSVPGAGWTPAIRVSPPATRVLIANDSPVTRIGLRTLLEGQGFAVCAEVGDASAAVEAAAREVPDLCLLDIKIPGDGIAAIQSVLEAAPETAVVVLTGSQDEADFMRALQAGAAGYILLEDADTESLAHALHTVLGGKATLPRRFLPMLVGDLAARRKHIRTGIRGALTSREEEILELLAEGLTTAEIARRLFVSQVTVRTHICSIRKKLEVHDRQAAVRLLNPAPDPAAPGGPATEAVPSRDERSVSSTPR
jgi:two-component system nitrate/nitrite response regulator NarL